MPDDQSYCEKCRFRLNKRDTKSVLACEVGYTVNPKSHEATKNATKNGSQVCNQNPWKFKQ